LAASYGTAPAAWRLLAVLPALPNPITREKGQATTTWFEATALSAKFPVSLTIAHTFLA
jgi:hypothetical protein